MHAQSIHITIKFLNLKREENFKSGKCIKKKTEKKSIINILLTPNHAA